MRGELSLNGDATIMGCFDGDVRVAGVLECATAARVSGTVIAGTLQIAGQVDADVIAEQGLELLAGSKLSGRLFSTRVSVCEGGEYEGEINVGPQALKAAVAWIEQLKREQQEQPAGAPSSSAAQPAAEMPDPQAEPAPPADGSEGSPPQIDLSVIGSILSQRRAQVLAAGEALQHAAAEAKRVAG